ncbi:MAG: UDPglucose 6-dehydrogenase, partial [Thermodesulfobacterium sp.]|nr:UDPglucose 6-dehydrogenase [Thermodesulfobacterium sp.]
KEKFLGDLKDKTIGILGLSFKPNTSDVRESPALSIIPVLLEKGAKVKVYDPVAMEEFRKAAKGLNIEYASDPLNCATQTDGLVLLTEWNEFRFLNLSQLKKVMKNPLIIDMRNIYEPSVVKSLGFSYEGIGRL